MAAKHPRHTQYRHRAQRYVCPSTTHRVSNRWAHSAANSELTLQAKLWSVWGRQRRHSQGRTRRRWLGSSPSSAGSSGSAPPRRARQAAGGWRGAAEVGGSGGPPFGPRYAVPQSSVMQQWHTARVLTSNPLPSSTTRRTQASQILRWQADPPRPAPSQVCRDPSSATALEHPHRQRHRAPCVVLPGEALPSSAPPMGPPPPGSPPSPLLRAGPGPGPPGASGTPSSCGPSRNPPATPRARLSPQWIPGPEAANPSSMSSPHCSHSASTSSRSLGSARKPPKHRSWRCQ